MTNGISRLHHLFEVLDVGQLVDAFRSFSMTLSQYTQSLLGVFGVKVGKQAGMFFGLLFLGIALYAYFDNWKIIVGAIILYVVAISMGVI